MRLRTLHRAPLDVPGHSPEVAVSVVDLLALGPDDVVVWGLPPFEAHPERLPSPGPLILAIDPAVVSTRRAAGGRALLIPDLTPPTLARALSPGGLIGLEGGTLVVDRGEWWVAGAVVRLPGRERAVLGALAAATAPLTAAALGSTGRAAEATVRRLRARIGPSHVPGTARTGWMLVTPERRPSPVEARPLADLVLDAARVDANLQRGTGPAGPFTLSALETRLLALLASAPGEVSRAELEARLWGRAGDRRRLDLLVHRLRGKLGREGIERIGHGYRLNRPTVAAAPAPPSEPISAAAVAGRAVRGRPVSLVGPPGVGKSVIGRAVAAMLGARLVDVHDAPISVARRALGRGLDPIVLDGLEDAAELSADLRAAASARPVVLTARAPAGLPEEEVVRCEPWSVERLRASFPGRSVDGADGLPGACLGEDLRLGSLPLPVQAALGRLSHFGRGFGRAEAESVLQPDDPRPDELVRRGLLTGAGRGYRFLEPVRRGASKLAPADAAARGATAAALRLRAALTACPFDPDELVGAVPDAQAALPVLRDIDAERAAATVLDLQQSQWASGGPTDAAALAEALGAASDPLLRGEIQLALGLQLQYGRDSTAALRLFSEAAHGAIPPLRAKARCCEAQLHLEQRRVEDARRALELAQPDLSDGDSRGTSLWLYLQSRVQLADGSPAARQTLVAAAQRLERARWTPGDPLREGTRLRDSRVATLYNSLGAIDLYVDPPMARAAFLESMAAYRRIGHHRGALIGRLNLAKLDRDEAALGSVALGARALGMEVLANQANLTRALSCITSGRWAEAVPLLAQASGVAVRLGLSEHVLWGEALQLLIAVCRGDATAVEQFIPALAVLQPAHEAGPAAVRALVRLVAGGGDPEEADRAFDALPHATELGQVLRRLRVAVSETGVGEHARDG